MEHLNKLDDQWVPLQIKVFSRWMTSQLKDIYDIQIDDITKDLSNGVALCNLATLLTQKDRPRGWVLEPKRQVDMVQNCELALEMFQSDGVKLVGISGKDINDNNEKLILGLVWSLIVHYSVDKSVQYDVEKDNNIQQISKETENKANIENRIPVKDSKRTLLSWASTRTANYPNIKNFQPFNLSLCALLDTYVPEKINYYNLDPKNSQHNSELATNVMKDLGIPVLVYPEEIEDHNNKVDEKILLTQLSSAKFVLDKKVQTQHAASGRIPIPSKQSSLTSSYKPTIKQSIENNDEETNINEKNSDDSESIESQESYSDNEEYSSDYEHEREENHDESKSVAEQQESAEINDSEHETVVSNIENEDSDIEGEETKEKVQEIGGNDEKATKLKYSDFADDEAEPMSNQIEEIQDNRTYEKIEEKELDQSDPDNEIEETADENENEQIENNEAENIDPIASKSSTETSSNLFSTTESYESSDENSATNNQMTIDESANKDKNSSQKSQVGSSTESVSTSSSSSTEVINKKERKGEDYVDNLNLNQLNNNAKLSTEDRFFLKNILVPRAIIIPRKNTNKDYATMFMFSGLKTLF